MNIWEQELDRGVNYNWINMRNSLVVGFDAITIINQVIDIKNIQVEAKFVKETKLWHRLGLCLYL